MQQFLGSAGSGKEWHHIVEQCQAKASRAGFSAFWINNTNNVINISKSVHSNISKFYSGKQNIAGFVNTGGKTFRDWISTMSFQQQYEWGIKILRYFGVNI